MKVGKTWVAQKTVIAFLRAQALLMRLAAAAKGVVARAGREAIGTAAGVILRKGGRARTLRGAVAASDIEQAVARAAAREEETGSKQRKARHQAPISHV